MHDGRISREGAVAILQQRGAFIVAGLVAEIVRESLRLLGGAEIDASETEEHHRPVLVVPKFAQSHFVPGRLQGIPSGGSVMSMSAPSATPMETARQTPAGTTTAVFFRP
jgi:hypothetical protein